MVKTRDVIVILIILILAIFASGCLSTSSDTSTGSDFSGSEITCTSPYIVAGSSCCLDENSNKICDVDEEDAPATPAPTTSPPITAPPTTRAPVTQPPQTTSAPVTLPPTTQPPTTLAKATTTTTAPTTATSTTTTTTTLPSTRPPPTVSKSGNLAQYMVGIGGYEQTRLGPEDLCDLLHCDMGAKYTKQPMIIGLDRSVFVEIYIHPEGYASATSWMREKQYGNQSTESRDWHDTTIDGYQANIKAVGPFFISDSKENQVFLRVAVGNVGIQTRFTQRVNKNMELTPLEEMEAMVREVTSAIITSFGG